MKDDFKRRVDPHSLGSYWFYGLLLLPFVSLNKVKGEVLHFLSSDLDENDSFSVLLAQTEDNESEEEGESTQNDETSEGKTPQEEVDDEGFTVTLLFNEMGELIAGHTSLPSFRDRPVDFDLILPFSFELLPIPPAQLPRELTFIFPKNFEEIVFTPDESVPEITPLPFNTPPLALDLKVTVKEDDAPITLPFAVIDPDGDPTMVSILSFVPLMNVGILTDNGNGTFSYDSQGVFNSLNEGEMVSFSFTYQARDSLMALSNIATVSLMVTGCNDPPQATSSSIMVFDVMDGIDLNQQLLTNPMILRTGNVLTDTQASDPDTSTTLYVKSIGGFSPFAAVSPDTYHVLQGPDGEDMLGLSFDEMGNYRLFVLPTDTSSSAPTTQHGLLNSLLEGGALEIQVPLVISDGFNDITVQWVLTAKAVNDGPTIQDIDLSVTDVMDGLELTQEEQVSMNTRVGDGDNLLSKGMLFDPDTGDMHTITSMTVGMQNLMPGTHVINGPDGQPMLNFMFSATGEYQLSPVVDMMTGSTIHEGLNALKDGESFVLTGQITVADQGGKTATSNLTLTVQGANDAPVASDDQTAFFAGQAFSVLVTNNDQDIDGDLLNVINISGGDPAIGFMRGMYTSGGLYDSILHSGNPDLIPGIIATGDFDPNRGPSGEFTGSVAISVPTQYTVSDSLGKTDTANVSLLVKDPFWFNFTQPNPNRSLELFTLNPNRHALKLVNLPNLSLHDTLCQAIGFEILNGEYTFTFNRNGPNTSTGAFSAMNVPLPTDGTSFPQIVIRLDTNTDLIATSPTYGTSDVVVALLGTLGMDTIVGTQTQTDLVYGLSTTGETSEADSLYGDGTTWDQFAYVGTGTSILNSVFAPDLIVGYGSLFGDVGSAHLGSGFQNITLQFGNDVIKAPATIVTAPFTFNYFTSSYGDAQTFLWRIFTENMPAYGSSSGMMSPMTFNNTVSGNSVWFGMDWFENGTLVHGDTSMFRQFVGSGQGIDPNTYDFITVTGDVYPEPGTLQQFHTVAGFDNQLITFGNDMLAGSYDQFVGDSLSTYVTLLAGRVGAVGGTSSPSSFYVTSLAQFSESRFHFGHDTSTTTPEQAIPHALPGVSGNLSLSARGDLNLFEWVMKAAPAVYVPGSQLPSPNVSSKALATGATQDNVLVDTFRFGNDTLTGVKRAIGDVETYRIQLDALGAQIAPIEAPRPSFPLSEAFASNRVEVMDIITRFGNDELRALVGNSSTPIEPFQGVFVGDVDAMDIVLKSGETDQGFLQPRQNGSPQMVFSAESRVIFMNNQFVFGDDLMKGGGQLWGDVRTLNFFLQPFAFDQITANGSFVDASGTKFTFGRDHLHGQSTDDRIVGDIETFFLTNPDSLITGMPSMYSLILYGDNVLFTFQNPGSTPVTFTDGLGATLETALSTSTPFLRYWGDFFNSSTSMTETKYTTFTFPEDIFGFDLSGAMGFGTDTIVDFRTMPYVSDQVVIERDYLQFKGVNSFGDLPTSVFSSGPGGVVRMSMGMAGTIDFLGYSFADYTRIELIEGTPNGMGVHFASHSSGVFATLKLTTPFTFYLDDPRDPVRDFSGFDPEQNDNTPANDQITLLGLSDSVLTPHQLCRLSSFEIIDDMGVDKYKLTVTNEMGTVIGMGTFDLPVPSTSGSLIPFTLVGSSDSDKVSVILGTEGPDSLTGTSDSELIIGFGGDDVISAGVGSFNSKSVIEPGAGNDDITLGMGVFTLKFDLNLLSLPGNNLGSDRVFIFETDLDGILEAGEDLLHFENVGQHDGNGTSNELTDLLAISRVVDNGMGNVSLEIYDRDIGMDNDPTGDGANLLLSIAFSGVAYSSMTEDIDDVVASGALTLT